ncbi:trehalase family glycosidase [Limibacter armeniacum]|uniref:amylo-alpha-1,6-glucosidase n=1 Tax=Limibacter armeniacum TaxID=466084 RepID=UPI002FE64D78
MTRKEFIHNSASVAAGYLMLPGILRANSLTQKPSILGNGIPSNLFPNLNLDHFIFSKSGSFMVVNYKDKATSHRLMLKTLRYEAIPYKWHKEWAGDYYEIALYKDGKELPYTLDYKPWSMELLTSNGKAVISFMDENTLYMGAEHLEVRMMPIQPYLWINPIENGKEIELSPNPGRIFHHFKTAKHTQMQLDYKEEVRNTDAHLNYISFKAEKGKLCFGFREGRISTKWPTPIPDAEEVITQNKADIDQWMDKMPNVPVALEASAKTAWYMLYAFQVQAIGKYTHPMIVCSKNSWLTRVWGWDNCFHAMAVAQADQELAWGQLKTFFDNQLPNGAIPDSISDLNTNQYCIKPPVYGWTISQLIKQYGWDKALPHLQELYEPLGKLTNYWYNFRDPQQHMHCRYFHGNDSGWDNATAFDYGTPLAGADLVAYLTIQLEVLAEIAQKLNKKEEAKMWKEKANKQLKVIKRDFIKDQHFVHLDADGKPVKTNSLLHYIPLLLAKRLPENVTDTLVKELGIGGHFLTEYGFASEAINSPEYTTDGYWRGPIWAPPNYQLFTALLELGETDLARTVAERYCNTYKKYPTFNENNNALTGEGLQAPGVSWTASAFILMASWLEKNA